MKDPSNKTNNFSFNKILTKLFYKKEIQRPKKNHIILNFTFSHKIKNIRLRTELDNSVILFTTLLILPHLFKLKMAKRNFLTFEIFSFFKKLRNFFIKKQLYLFFILDYILFNF